MKNITKQIVMVGLAGSFFLPSPLLLDLQDQNRDAFEIPDTTEGAVLAQSNSLLPIVSPETPTRIAKVIPVVVTAYSSTPWQTDDTPFITASGNWVRSGIVATNLLPFGTKIRIPDIYGDRVFVVDDRMHPTKLRHVDIWFPTYREAKWFGARYTHIEVLES